MLKQTKVKNITPLEGSISLLRKSANLRKGEKVLIITELGVDNRVSDTLMKAVKEIGGESVVIKMDKLKYPGAEPPKIVSDAMLSSDLIISATSSILFYTDARTKACDSGARFISMTGVNMEVLASEAMTVDFRKNEPIVIKFKKILDRAKRVRLTSESGTLLELSVLGRTAIVNSGICDRAGMYCGAPDIEAYIAPIEDSVEGKIVIDGSTSVTGLVTDPITITFKHGLATDIDGGAEAKKLIEILNNTESRESFKVGELGIGLNPLAKVRGANIEDEGSLGTAHIALGNNVKFGGKINAPTHIDNVMRKVTLSIDGYTPIKKGKLLLKV
jgi:leucyl aminopeptidase (aminopeptidase T)